MPYYNQNMSPADWYNKQQENRGSNVQNVLNMIMTMKQFKMNQEKERSAKELEAKRYSDTQARQQKAFQFEQEKQRATEDYRTKSLEIAGRPKPLTIDERRQGYADFLYKNNELTDEEYKQFKLTTTLPKKEGLTTFQKYSKTSTEMSRAQSYVRNKITDYRRGITSAKEPMSQAEMFGIYAAGGTPDIKIDTEGIGNLENATRILSMLEMIVQDRQWTSDEKKIMTYIAGNRGKIQEGGLEAETSPSTGFTRVKIRGQWVTFK